MPLRLLILALFLLLLAGGSWALISLHRQDQELDTGLARIRHQHLELQNLRDRVQTAETEKAALRQQLEGAHQEQQRLEAELHRELSQRQGVNQKLEELAAAMRADRERYNREIWADKKFMPEGVRLAVMTLHELFHADGHDGLRVLKAGRIEDKSMFDVQILEQEPGALNSALYVAGELRFELDRARAVLVLRLLDGFRRGPEGRADLPEEGYRLELLEVDGRSWERRLPYLVRPEGEYPAPAQKPDRPRMAPRLKALWRKRLNELLGQSTMRLSLRMDSFSYLKGAEFRDALLLGYDQGKVLQMSVEAERIGVVVQRKAGLVELCCFEGTLRGKGGETTIPPAGHRILLRGVTPEMARDVMLGMVVEQ